MIKAKDLTKTYPNGAEALKHIDLSLERGELAFLKGPSGAGKTTLFKLMMGMEDPSSGSLVVDDCRMEEGNPMAIRALRRRLGVIFQDFRLIKGRTARENVEMGMRVLGASGPSLPRTARSYLEKLGLGDKTETYVDLLSWGEQQRVVIARALARKPSIILADEPTGNLDEISTGRVIDLLLAASNEGATVLVATHAADVLDRAGHRLIALEDGRVALDTGNPRGVTPV